MSDLSPALVLSGLVWAGLLALVLHQLARTRYQWLTACFIASGLYVVLALRLDAGPTPSPLIDGLRWGLLSTALFSFFRYRRSRKS